MPRATSSEPVRRILVYGVTGSGKSTAAEAIAAQTRSTVTSSAVAGGVVARERWVLDAAYGAWLDVVPPRVELVVGLDYPRWFSLQLVVRRTLMCTLDKKPICNGNTQSLRRMPSRDSIVGWHFRSFARKRARMRSWEAATDGPEVLRFRRPRELRAWIDGLEERPLRSRIRR